MRTLGDVKMAAELTRLEAENAALREAFIDAIDSVEEYSQYAGDYLCKKHGVPEMIAKWRALLIPQQEDKP